ncbi:hypothetical protein ACHAWF_005942 [Thalassiosira exigua]
MSFLQLDSTEHGDDDKRGETSSPSLFSTEEEHVSSGNQLGGPDPGQPAHTIGSTSNPGYHNASQHQSSDHLSTHAGKWTKDDIMVVIVLPIILGILLLFSCRHCYIANRRHAQFHAQRQSARTAARAQAREQRRLSDERKKERAKEIDKALVTKTASKCNCGNTHLSAKKSFDCMTDLTVRTNVTDDTSVSSSNDIENPVVDDNSSPIASDSDEADCNQTCAICLESFTGGKDKVSWSKFQTCHHAFHEKCIKGWLSETKNTDGNCPCCRGPYLREGKDAARGAAAQISLTGEEDNANGENHSEVTDNISSHSSRQGSERNSYLVVEEGICNDDERVIGAIGTHADGDVTNASPNPDGCANAESEVETSVSQEKAMMATQNMDKINPMGSEFTSFCIIHGLR